MKKSDIVVALDWEYLKYWAAKLNLSDLLSRSLDDAGMVNST